MRDQHSPYSAENCVGTEKCLIGQAKEREHGLAKAPGAPAQCSNNMLHKKDIIRFLKQIQ